MTFSTIAEVFYRKTEAKGINFKPKLDIMLRVTKDIDAIRAKYVCPVHDFMKESNVRSVLNNVPRTLKVDDVEARVALNDFITVLNDGQQFERETCQAIVTEIDVKCANKYSPTIDYSYTIWQNKSITRTWIKYIERLIESISNIEKFWSLI